MLELLPTLLAELPLIPVDANTPQPNSSQLVAPQELKTPAATVPVAPPEASSIEFMPPSLVTTTAQPPISEMQSPLLAPAVAPNSVPAPANPPVANETAQPSAAASPIAPANPAPQPAVAPSATAPTAQATSAPSPAATAQPPAALPTEALPTTGGIPIFVPPPEAPAMTATGTLPAPATAPVAPASGDQNSDAAIRARRQVIEQRLAEIVARDRQAKAAKQQEGTITAAIESAKQGNFEQAQQLLQDPSISPAVQTEVMGRINALKLAETPRLTPPATPVIVPVAPGTQSAVQQPTQPTPPTLATQPGTSPLALSPETRSPIARRFDLPGPKFAGAAPTENAGAGNGSQAGNYNTTPLGQQQATASPAMRYPGNSNVRLRYPLPTPEPITSPFGWRVHPVTGQRRLHTGTDIGAAEGTPILAAYSGKVSTADQLGGYGLAVVIEHNNGSQDTLYAHMSQILVRPGQWVEQGSVIGRVGSTGMSTGPHLHFELRHKTSDGWQTLDPGPYLLAAKNELIRAMQSAQSLPQPNQTAI